VTEEKYERRRAVQMVKKNGEINGTLGSFCNKIMQVGGTGVVLISLPALCGIVWQNHTSSVETLATLTEIKEDLRETIGRPEYLSELNRINLDNALIREQSDQRHNENQAKFALHRGLIRENSFASRGKK
tara:strand:- start:6343 stop:6732 length:390 start_codon:yes stop_codon:yes gene_type:complete